MAQLHFPSINFAHTAARSAEPEDFIFLAKTLQETREHDLDVRSPTRRRR